MFEEVTIGECWLILGDCREVLPLGTKGEAKARRLGLTPNAKSEGASGLIAKLPLD